MTTLQIINLAIMLAFFLCYSYQFFYIPVAWWKKDAPHREPVMHRIAVLIAARNEQAVIGNLIDSIRAQDYPADKVDVFVVADNCTDLTGTVAGAHGATVYFRSSTTQVGKGYALQYLLRCIEDDYAPYDGYLVLDADNVLSPNYITEINKTFSDGYEIVTSYRNSKNYGDNWISAGYALWFLRESRYLNGARCRLGSSCAVSGTGFLFSRRILNKCGGWNFFLLTEDIQFTIANVIRGEKVGYCPTAVLYDEQPTTFRQSFRQRLRWSRGYLQVFGKYGTSLFRGIFRGSFSCFDMTMNIMPAAVLSGASIAVNLGAAVYNCVNGGDWTVLAACLLQSFLSLYLTVFVLGVITTITEWDNIYCSATKKVWYAITFPVFMFTYIPIVIVSLFHNPAWQPIHHSRSVDLHQICAGK